MEYEWDPAKARANVRKHRISFADAALALEDPRALTVADPDASGEQRFVSLGSARISSRKASRDERRAYESK